MFSFLLLLLLQFLADSQICNALLMPYVSCNSKLAPCTHINTGQRCWSIPCRWPWPMRCSVPSPYEHIVWQDFKRALYLASAPGVYVGPARKLVGQQRQEFLTLPAPEVDYNLTQTFPDVPRWKRVRIQLKFVSVHLSPLAERTELYKHRAWLCIKRKRGHFNCFTFNPPFYEGEKKMFSFVTTSQALSFPFQWKPFKKANAVGSHPGIPVRRRGQFWTSQSRQAPGTGWAVIFKKYVIRCNPNITPKS